MNSSDGVNIISSALEVTGKEIHVWIRSFYREVAMKTIQSP